MHNATMNEVLDLLHGKRELGPGAPRGWVKALRHFGIRLCKLSISCFPILLIFIVYISSSQRPFPAILSIGKFISICQMFSALGWLLLEIIAMTIDLINFRNSSFERRKAEIAYDFAAASDLLIYDLNTLQAVDKWLSLKIDRMKVGLVFFFGGSDKVAIFALLGTSWSVLHNIPSGVLPWVKEVYIYAIALLTGMAIGGVMLNMLTKNLSYQRDLLALAIQHKTNNPP